MAEGMQCPKCGYFSIERLEYPDAYKLHCLHCGWQSPMKLSVKNPNYGGRASFSDQRGSARSSGTGCATSVLIFIIGITFMGIFINLMM